MRGSNAAKAFQQTRGARFADSRRRTEEERRAAVAAGTRRETVMVSVDEVREDDEVAAVGGGFVNVATASRADWNTHNGMTFVRRFTGRA